MQIINYYKTRPMTLQEVSEHFNICCPTIGKILKEYHIKTYTRVQLYSPDLIENYFERIDTEEKAYFLGLIITDGCVHNTKGRQSLVNITLDSKDEYLLKAFKKEIKSNKTVTHDGRGCSQINILSNKMVNNLKQYGILPNKSLHTIFPTNIPKHLYKHLIRGILDGDGSVSFYARRDRKKSHTKAIRFCQGNEQFLKDLVDFLYTECGIQRINLYKEKDSLWSIAYRKNESMIKLIDYIYDDAHIYMKRKKRLCDLIYAEACTYGDTEITEETKESSAL